MLPLALLLFFQQEPNDLEQAIRTFTGVYALVEGNAADAVNPDNAIYEAALPALLRKLDPHSVFLTPAQFEQLKEMERSSAKGFGTVVSVLPGRVIILQTTPGAPSQKAGIAPGDEIVAVNNYRVDRLDMEQLIGNGLGAEPREFDYFELLHELNRAAALKGVQVICCRSRNPALNQLVNRSTKLASSSSSAFARTPKRSRSARMSTRAWIRPGARLSRSSSRRRSGCETACSRALR